MGVALYMMPGCAVCTQVRRHLERAQVRFEVRWLSEPEHADWVHRWIAADASRKGSAPFLAIDGQQVVQGYDPRVIDAALAAAGLGAGASPGAPESQPRRGAAPPEGWWVCDIDDGALRFLPPDAAPDAAALEPYELGPGSMPIAVAHEPASDTVAVSDFAGARVVFFDRRTGLPAGGDLASSCLAVPAQPSDIVVDARRGRFYVVCAEGGAVVMIDAATRDFAGGSRASATISTGGPTAGSLAFDPGLDRLYVRRLDDVLALDVAAGTALAPSPRLGMGRNVAVDARTHTLFVPALDGERRALEYLDARTGAFLNGDRAASGVGLPGSPFGLVADPGRGAVFVASLAPDVLGAFDVAGPRPLPGGGDLPMPGAARTLALDATSGVIAASVVDRGAVVFLDASARAYRGGSLEAATVPVGGMPRGLAAVSPPR